MSAQIKAALRKQALESRQRMGGDQARLERLLDQALRPHAGRVLAGYWPMRGEADPRPAMQSHDAPVCLPVVTGRAVPLVFRHWDLGPLEAGPFGTSHPSESAKIMVPQVLIVPLVAYDRSGNRIGYGGGYYDRTLNRLRNAAPTVAIGLAYASQELDGIPAEEFDQRLDLIVTDDAVIVP